VETVHEPEGPPSPEPGPSDEPRGRPSVVHGMSRRPMAPVEPARSPRRRPLSEQDLRELFGVSAGPGVRSGTGADGESVLASSSLAGPGQHRVAVRRAPDPGGFPAAALPAEGAVVVVGPFPEALDHARRLAAADPTGPAAVLVVGGDIVPGERRPVDDRSADEVSSSPWGPRPGLLLAAVAIDGDPPDLAAARRMIASLGAVQVRLVVEAGAPPAATAAAIAGLGAVHAVDEVPAADGADPPRRFPAPH
jgi:hypothetical protein